jgi:hypothetical protein
MFFSCLELESIIKYNFCLITDMEEKEFIDFANCDVSWPFCLVN